MHRYKNIVIIGTSHIAQESISQVEKTITLEAPDLVALELDKARYHALTTSTKRRPTLKDITHLGFKGWLFAVFGELAERKLGNKVGVSPGTEMLKAAVTARANNCSIALIDQPLDVTLKKFSKSITWKEKFRFLKDLLFSPFSKQKISIDLTKVPEQKLVQHLIKQLKTRYPNVHKTLVEDRNKYMAKNLLKLTKHFKKIVAVVGAGHEKELVEELKKIETD
ncbi:MAG TPA: TraB family protein [Candidatus Nanoarchaeia archaeon]|nr:TraB family protein [Candidatus Nanoarchaeia archaeon]